jgi:E-phenylitaconyl-CoA hydratase
VKAAALDIMLSARPFDAAQALELGLVNAVVDDSIAAALDLARRSGNP